MRDPESSSAVGWISPTILVGLDRHRARGAFRGLSDVRHLIVPMGLGTIAGGIAGGLLVTYVPAGAVKELPSHPDFYTAAICSARVVRCGSRVIRMKPLL